MSMRRKKIAKIDLKLIFEKEYYYITDFGS
jgi:hypothetical protein